MTGNVLNPTKGYTNRTMLMMWLASMVTLIFIIASLSSYFNIVFDPLFIGIMSIIFGTMLLLESIVEGKGMSLSTITKRPGDFFCFIAGVVAVLFGVGGIFGITMIVDFLQTYTMGIFSVIFILLAAEGISNRI